jgi:hypothetical protein
VVRRVVASVAAFALLAACGGAIEPTEGGGTAKTPPADGAASNPGASSGASGGSSGASSGASGGSSGVSGGTITPDAGAHPDATNPAECPATYSRYLSPCTASSNGVRCLYVFADGTTKEMVCVGEGTDGGGSSYSWMPAP